MITNQYASNCMVPAIDMAKMLRDGAIIFSDLIGKLDALRVSCDKCGRDGCYGLARLINQRGRVAQLPKVL